MEETWSHMMHRSLRMFLLDCRAVMDHCKSSLLFCNETVAWFFSLWVGRTEKSHLAEPQTHIVWWDMLTALLAGFEKGIVWLHHCRGLNVFNMSHLSFKWRISSADREKLLIYPKHSCSFSCVCVLNPHSPVFLWWCNKRNEYPLILLSIAVFNS